jgi:hypothetical protein
VTLASPSSRTRGEGRGAVLLAVTCGRAAISSAGCDRDEFLDEAKDTPLNVKWVHPSMSKRATDG